MYPIKLTIAIPTRNRSQLVTRLVTQCLAQTGHPFEIIVSDNASEDDTIQQLQKLSDPRLCLLRQRENIGMIPNWNACLASARGEFLVLISDDDMIAKDFVESIGDVLLDVPNADILLIRAKIINDLTAETDENLPPVNRVGYVDFIEEILPSWLSFRFTIPLVSMVFRTSVLRDHGGFSMDFPYAADAATGFPIAIAGCCAFYPEPKVSYLIHAGMATRGYSVEALVDDVIRLTALVIDKVREVRGNDSRLLQELKESAKTYQRKSFGYLMITSARRGLSQRKLLSFWLKYAWRLPKFGFDPLSLGAVFVPRPMIQFMGYPYRKYVSWRKKHQ